MYFSYLGHSLNLLTISSLGTNQCHKYTPFRNERDNLFQSFSLMESSKNEFHFFTCILTDYVAHESPKEF